MKLQKEAIAGTLESSDIQIMLSPNHQEGVVVDLESQVMEQFGKQIKHVITSVIDSYHIEDVTVKAIDKGALDCVIKARLQTAIHRSLGIQNQDTPWEGIKK